MKLFGPIKKKGRTGEVFGPIKKEGGAGEVFEPIQREKSMDEVFGRQDYSPRDNSAKKNVEKT